MSKYFFDRLEVGYKGEKTVSTGVCNLSYCTNPRTTYKGIGERLCEKHQRLMREYGGPGRTDRPYTFNKSKTEVLFIVVEPTGSFLHAGAPTIAAKGIIIS